MRKKQNKERGKKMSKKSKNSDPTQPDFESITKRLDALIRVSLETHFDKNSKFNLTAAVKALNSCGLGPSEIASILGKKITDVAPLLYGKKKSKPKQSDKETETQNGEQNDN